MRATEYEWAQTGPSESRHDRDRALVIAAQAGSQGAFEALHRHYARAVFKLALSITKNPWDAEDVAQETFMNAYRGLKSFRKECQFTSWLTRIAINSSLMFLRRRRNRRELSIDPQLDSDCNIGIDLVDSRPSPERFLHMKEAVGRIETCVEHLPKHLRLVAELRVLQEQSTKEICSALGISNAAVKARLHRARKRIASKGLQNRLRQQSALGTAHGMPAARGKQ